MSDVETRSVELAEVEAGVRLIAGHAVVLVVNGAKGARKAKAGVGKKDLNGTFRVGDHVLTAVAFRLHKDTADGPLITPDTLAGGKTALRWDKDHWASGDDGKYVFSGLPAAKYFIELVGDDGKAS